MFTTAMRDLAAAERARLDAQTTRRDAMASRCPPAQLFLLWCADQLDARAAHLTARWDFLNDD